MEQGGLTKHLNAKHRLVSSQSSEAALTKVPPSAPTKAQMGSVLDDMDIDIDVPDSILLDDLLRLDAQLLSSDEGPCYDGEVGVGYDGAMPLTL